MSDCQACGACCAYSAAWPIFTLESDADLDLIPRRYVSDDLRGMACDGDRCSALAGQVGVATSCSVYEQRPDVCGECQPGDEPCVRARAHHGLPPLA